MEISFVRVDDRVIHGQIVTAWSKEFPCDGIIAVDDKIAQDPVLSNVFKGAAPSGVKVWIFDIKTALEKLPKIIESNKKYFIIAKTPVVFQKLTEGGADLRNDNNNKINVGPMHLKDGARTIGPNAAVTKEEEEAFDYLAQRYKVEFKLIPDKKAYYWEEVK